MPLLALPFGKQRARQQAHRHAPINLALHILREAAQRSAEEPVGKVEVRLALHVLRLLSENSTCWSSSGRQQLSSHGTHGRAATCRIGGLLNGSSIGARWWMR